MNNNVLPPPIWLLERRRMMMESKHDLPNGYTALSYLELVNKAGWNSTAHAYIDTGIVPNPENFGFEVKFYAPTIPTNGGQEPISCNGNDFNLIVSTYKTTVTSTGYITLKSGSNNYKEPHFIKGDNHVMYKDGVLISNGYLLSPINIGGNAGVSIHLFTRASDKINSFQGRTYYVKIWNNGKIVRDFVPCISPSNEYGMYDLVSRRFFGSNNSYKFTGK